jgi:hypothetical protein
LRICCRLWLRGCGGSSRSMGHRGNACAGKAWTARRAPTLCVPPHHHHHPPTHTHTT